MSMGLRRILASAAAAAALAASPFHAEQTLSRTNASWSLVLTGRVLTDPLPTEYGFVAVTDARTITGISGAGKILWEKPLMGADSATMMTALPGGLVAAVTGAGMELVLLNPDGAELWRARPGFRIAGAPYAGRDGRIFVTGDSSAACFGATGVMKWRVPLPVLSSVAPRALQDGSIVVFTEGTADGKSRGIRISPFGETMESITFAGDVASAESCADGILLSFTDGSAGLVADAGGRSEGVWVLKGGKSSAGGKFAVPEFGQEAVYVCPSPEGAAVSFLDPASGHVRLACTAGSVKGSRLSGASLTGEGVFVSDGKNAVLVGRNGRQIWSAELPDRQGRFSWNASVFTDDSRLVLCMDDWSLNAYRASQSAGTSGSARRGRRKGYGSFYSVKPERFGYVYGDGFGKTLAGDGNFALLNAGGYGPVERGLVSDLMSACSVYAASLNSSDFGSRTELSVFESDGAGTERLLSMLPLFGTDTFTGVQSSVLRRGTDRTQVNAVLRGIGTNGYDPDGKLLESLDFLASRRNDSVTARNICAATESVCRFMGADAFSSRGKEILSGFLSPRYDSTVRSAARDTLRRLSASGL